MGLFTSTVRCDHDRSRSPRRVGKLVRACQAVPAWAVVIGCGLAFSGCGSGGGSEGGSAARTLIDHGASVLFGDIPKVKTAAEIQQDALKGVIKSSACDWLDQYVTTQQEPDSSVFFDTLRSRLSSFGSPAQNEADALEAEFDHLRNTLTGQIDARDAAKHLACSFLPG